MQTTATVLRWMVRVAGILALLLGIGFWNGSWFNLLSAHQGLGYLVAVALLLLAILGFSRRLAPGLPVLALLWGLAVPAVGAMQLRLLPGANHWLIEVLHALLGVGAIALSEIIGGRLARGGAPARA